jgi:polyisoprenoid-binding protein YceI
VTPTVGLVTVSAETYKFGPTSGQVLIRTSRAGLAARAGHDLVLEVTRWSAAATVPGDDDVAASTISAELDLGSLAVREGTGGAKPLTSGDRADIERTIGKILGGGTATFTSSRVIPAPSVIAGRAVGGAVEGTVTLNGRTQPVRLQVQAPASGSSRYRGSATVTQTGFGITPYTGFFGALKLKDEVTLEFDVDLSRTAPAA